MRNFLKLFRCILILLPFNAFSAEQQLINKYKIWKKISQNPTNSEEIFRFFYQNPNWPMFSELTKKAEQNIPQNQKNDIFIKWFSKYPPKTPNGIISYSRMLLKHNKSLGIKYINQTWVYQNLSPDFAKKFKHTFSKEITEISDAMRMKRLLKKKDKRQLASMLPLVPDYMKKFIPQTKNIKSEEDPADYDNRYNAALALSKANKYKEAAAILVTSNKGENSSSINFFNLRRDVACNLARAGHPLLSYKVISMHTLNRQHSTEKKNYVKAEWFAGFIAFRFLDDKKNSLKHFQNAYETSGDSVHKSKNAFWLAEVYLSLNNTISAFDWFKQAYEFSNTFYGQIAWKRLTNISVGRFLSGHLQNVSVSVIAQAKKNFNSRELVQILKILAKYNLEKDIKFLTAFYKKLIDDIDDPNEEQLLMTLTTTEAERKFIIESEAGKQKYFSDRKTFKILKPDNLTYIKRVNADECFIGLVHAIIKRESMFNPKAKSYAGAKGLMQIMPATAEFEMSKINFYTGKGVSLFNVEKNLTIGSFLLNRLLQKYNNNLIHVMYAYNAGEGNLNKFKKSIKNLTGLTVIDEIELIPIKETRIYVKHGIYNLLMYSDIFGQDNCYNCQAVGIIKSAQK